jgi:hypothetical protein
MKIKTFYLLDPSDYFEDIQEGTELVFVCGVLFFLISAKQRNKCHSNNFCNIIQRIGTLLQIS